MGIFIFADTSSFHPNPPALLTKMQHHKLWPLGSGFLICPLLDLCYPCMDGNALQSTAGSAIFLQSRVMSN